VDQRLVGCWRRAVIRFADGTVDDRSDVLWLQTFSTAMADLRLAADRPALTAVDSLTDCSMEQLVALAGSDSSSGHTTVVPDHASPDGVIATWHAGADGVDFQPMTSFPEPGLLSWSADGQIMTERAPSGAYDEQWHRLPGSDGPSGHVVTDGAVRQGWYVVGDHAMYVRDRSVPVPSDRRIDELMSTMDPSQRAWAEALVDCELSYALLVDQRWIIQLSTLPWRQGAELEMTPLDDVLRSGIS
jgi:hypothetical protein